MNIVPIGKSIIRNRKKKEYPTQIPIASYKKQSDQGSKSISSGTQTNFFKRFKIYGIPLPELHSSSQVPFSYASVEDFLFSLILSINRRLKQYWSVWRSQENILRDGNESNLRLTPVRTFVTLLAQFIDSKEPKFQYTYQENDTLINIQVYRLQNSGFLGVGQGNHFKVQIKTRRDDDCFHNENVYTYKDLKRMLADMLTRTGSGHGKQSSSSSFNYSDTKSRELAILKNDLIIFLLKSLGMYCGAFLVGMAAAKLPPQRLTILAMVAYMSFVLNMFVLKPIQSSHDSKSKFNIFKDPILQFLSKRL